MDRRKFLQGAGAAALATTSLSALMPRSAWAANLPGLYPYSPFSNEMHLPEPRSLAEVVEMSPMEIAQSSALISGVYEELHQAARSFEKAEYRSIMVDILTQPSQTWLSDLYPTDADRKAIFDEMAGLGYFDAEDDADYVFPPGHEKIQTMLTSPQSHNDWYGSYPGGMALIVAFNIRIADAHTEHYRQVYGLPVNRDISACALGIHEYPKSWFHSWNPDGSYKEEPRSLYGLTFHTHASYVCAELMHRRMDAALTMAVASAHAMGVIDVQINGRHTGVTLLGPSIVADIIHSASVLAQVDPYDYGVLKRKSDGKYEMATLPAEQWVTHLGDMSWPYTLGVAHPVTRSLLLSMAENDYGISANDLQAHPYVKPYNQLKNYIWSQLGEIALYEVIQREGVPAARNLVKRLVSA